MIEKWPDCMEQARVDLQSKQALTANKELDKLLKNSEQTSSFQR